MILPVGKPKIYIAKTDVDGNIGAWTLIDTPKDGTTTMETAEGDKTEYLEEGGGLVDTYQKQSKYTLKFQLYAKKGGEKPINDKNGVVTDNYAIKVVPEDPECYGFILYRCSVSCVETYSTADGILWEYTFNGLASPDHDEIMDYFVESEVLELDQNFVVLGASDTEGVNVTAKIGGGDIITFTDKPSWVTATAEEGVITIKASENEGEKRAGFVTIKSSKKTAQLKVIQSESVV